MEGPRLNGIILMSKKEIEDQQEKVDAKNFLQFAYAEKLAFLGQDEGSTLEEFINKYGKPIGDMLEDNPEVLNSYRNLLKDGKESSFDFDSFEELLKPYLPTAH